MTARIIPITKHRDKDARERQAYSDGFARAIVAVHDALREVPDGTPTMTIRMKVLQVQEPEE